MWRTPEEYRNLIDSLPPDHRERGKFFSAVVREGMGRVTADFTNLIKPSGFQRRRKTLWWFRKHDVTMDIVGVHRSGSYYGGAPNNASVDLRMMLSIAVLDGTEPENHVGGDYSDHLRKPSGGLYHFRFNAITGSMYDRCVEDMMAWLNDFAEPWFAKHRGAALLRHPDIAPETAARLRALLQQNGGL